MTELSRQDAIVVRCVSKRYKMFRDSRQMAAHHLGLRDIPFLRREPVPEFTALDDVSFKLARGERVGLIGRNGAGKTTMLKLLTRSQTPSAGRIEVNGSVQALMLNGIGFHPEFTGRQNIDATLRYYGLHGTAYDRAMNDVLDFAELGKYADQPFSTYSLGMQARTQFAVATAFEPDILLVDEMLGAGDGYFSAKSSERMKKMIQGGCTAIIVSHATDIIKQFCERVIWLRNGRVHRDGPATNVLAEYEQEMATLALSSAGVNAAAVANLDPFVLPASLRTAFVEEHVRAAEPVADPSAFEEIELGGTRGKVRRFRGTPGILIRDVRFSSAAVGRLGLEVGHSVDVEVELQADTAGLKPVRAAVLVYSLSGERLVIAQDTLHVDFPHSRSARVTASFERLQLGVGHYVVSILVEDPSAPSLTEEARYDLWSQCGSFSYAPTNESDPPTVHLDGWVRHGNAEPVRARMAGYL